jgi:hypothetical protein
VGWSIELAGVHTDRQGSYIAGLEALHKCIAEFEVIRSSKVCQNATDTNLNFCPFLMQIQTRTDY